jgi:hypothetical protein
MGADDPDLAWTGFIKELLEMFQAGQPATNRCLG